MLLGNNNALTSGAGKLTTCDVQLLLQGAERADLRTEKNKMKFGQDAG